MPAPLSTEVVARIVELRRAGLTIVKIAKATGVSRGAAGKICKAFPRQTPMKLPRSMEGRRSFYDDPRFDHPSEDEYADVVPIQFFPADLPRLETDPFWTPPRLKDACQWATELLHSQGIKTCS